MTLICQAHVLLNLYVAKMVLASLKEAIKTYLVTVR